MDGQRYYSFGFRRYPLEVGAQYRSYMAMLEVAAVGSTDELLMKASSKAPDLIRFIAIFRMWIRPKRDGLISPTLCSRRVDPSDGGAVPMVGIPERLPRPYW